MGATHISNLEEQINNSDQSNDYNPFNIPVISMANSNQFNSKIALMGSPPFCSYTKAQFTNLDIKKQAAFADGIVRGNHQKEWLKQQFLSINLSPNSNDSTVGAVAYMFLKTNNLVLFNELKKWNEDNLTNNDRFS